MSASSDEIPLSLSLPRPLQASPVCEALQYTYIIHMWICPENDIPRTAMLVGEMKFQTAGFGAFPTFTGKPATGQNHSIPFTPIVVHTSPRS